MKTLKYLQRFFMLQFVGFALCAVQACGDDEENEPIQEPNEEEVVKPDDGKDSIPADSIPNTEEQEQPVVTFKHFCPDENHPHAIDMGGDVKWACCNVDANYPHELGNRYAWGETETKEEFNYSNYKYFEGNYRIEGGWQKLERYDVTDLGEDIAGTQYDVAYVKWGSGYRIPDVMDYYYLIKYNTQEWTSLNGVKGLVLTSKKTGNRLFIPESSQDPGSRSRIEYWTSELYGTNYNCAAKTFIYIQGDDASSQIWETDYIRHEGRHIRPMFVE